MANEEIKDGLAEILEEVAGVLPADVSEEKSFTDDLDVDSLSKELDTGRTLIRTGDLAPLTRVCTALALTLSCVPLSVRPVPAV